MKKSLLQGLKTWGLGSICASALVLATTSASGQSSTSIDMSDIGGTDSSEIRAPQPETTKKTDDIEKLEVTGSLIKRIQVEGPETLITIDKEALDRSGYNSLSDVLREVTVSAFGGPREQSGSNAAGVASVNLRGLGPERTLVLLNGTRLPKDPITGAVDLNLVPMAAVAKIEILPDGASATYGSDALGGVVNIITRKDWSGTEATVRTTVPENTGGSRTDISVVNGINFGKTNVTTTVYYRKNRPLWAIHRDYTDDGFSATGSPGTAQKLSTTKRTKAGGPVGEGALVASEFCPEADKIEFESPTTGANSYCQYKWSDRATSLPEIEQLSIMNEVKSEFNASTRFFTRIIANQKYTTWQYAPAPGNLEIPSGAASKLNKGQPLQGFAAGDSLLYKYRMNELGDRISEIDTLSYSTTAGIERDLGETWEAKFTLSHNRLRKEDIGTSGYADIRILNELIETGGFNPAAADGQRGSLEAARYVPFENSMSELNQVELRASGEIFEMASGPVAMAIGTQFTSETYQDVFDSLSVQGLVFGNAGSSGGGSRSIYSGFTEFVVPLAKTWELQLAGRYDNFSDFGSTFNPKISTLYRPSNSWLLRASGGTGFKAPKMVDLYAATSNGFPTFLDKVACAKNGGNDCKPAQWNVTSGGNPGLKEEKSVFASMGAAYQPSQNFMIGFDTFYVKMDNVVDIDFEKATEAEQQGIDVQSFGITITRDANNQIVNMDAQLQNLASRELAGIDFKTDASTRTDIGRFSAAMTHSHLFFYKQELFPGLGTENILGRNSYPRFRNVMSFGYTPNGANLTSFFTARTIDRHEKAIAEPNHEIRRYTEYDITVNYAAPWNADISLGVKNVFGTTAPLDDTNGNNQLDPDLYDQVGRLVFAGYTQNF